MIVVNGEITDEGYRLLLSLVGGKLMGVLGMFLMIPLTALLYLLLREDVQQRIRSLDASATTEQPPAPESPDPPDSP